MSKPFIVGITGGSASGKTLFLKSLIDHFSAEEICLVSQDNYYKDRHLQPKDENGVENFDTPQSIEFDEYARDIKALKEGKVVTRKEYTFNNPNVVPEMLTFNPAKIIVVEGLFVFYFPELTKLLDLKVFIDAKDYVKLKRRIFRDNSERGYDLDDVLYRYEKHVAPTYEKYIEPFKFDADIIIPNNNKFDKGLEVLVSYLKEQSHD
ncbi:uridine kinase [Marivirga atlantica]|jgi:uridine kinase|uniref:uridine/cytidine kinase n=1 Tax=Marivirga atlantica TaxID=1548457 RepID=A0A937ADJ0_9BACT|nr:uridine kinase [Marivirga atlantica]MBL0764273.1 uridine kinase [Marivirga atlantica]